MRSESFLPAINNGLIFDSKTSTTNKPFLLDRNYQTTVTNSLETTELRGDQRPQTDDTDDGETPPIFFHLDDYHRHPFQYRRSTRIPFYHVNYITRGLNYVVS